MEADPDSGETQPAVSVQSIRPLRYWSMPLSGNRSLNQNGIIKLTSQCPHCKGRFRRLESNVRWLASSNISQKKWGAIIWGLCTYSGEYGKQSL